MKARFFSENASIFEEKGQIPYWMISNKLDCHVNTVRNWMKSRMTAKQKADVLAAIAEIKQELANAQ